MRKIIYVCSPLRGDISGNIERVKGYCKAIVGAGHIPYAPHLALDGVLDDNMPDEREKALSICIEMVKRCNEVWVFGDKLTEGMKKELEAAYKYDKFVKFEEDLTQCR